MAPRFFILYILLLNLAYPSSSISDFDGYKKSCLFAAKNNDLFNKFKIDSSYNAILEHVSFEQGLEYLDEIKKNELIISNLKDFSSNDKFGSPKTYKYEDFGDFSPTTLRYVKVLSDLYNMFGSLENLNIVEIGGGYGGQCLIISKLFNVKSYTIIDLKEPLLLAERYLKMNKIPNVKFINFEDLSADSFPLSKFDLCISNYAYTECSKSLQDIYNRKILFVSDSGYITSNAEVWESSFTYSSSEIINFLISQKKETKIFDEKPLTTPGNIIITWNVNES